MEKSKVYFTDFRAKLGEGLPMKLKRLLKKAGISEIDMENKFVAIKMHFGELGNISFLRPNYAKAVADVVKELGGKPFLTDCNTLYVGRRKNAIEHMDAAYENGYNPFATGCHVIIADGLKGTDEAIIPVEGGEYVKEAKIGQSIADADIFISMNHFKGHESTGFGGALKNIGMGCGSRAGKMEMHCSGKPVVNQDKCVFCGACRKMCAHGAISFNENKKANINHDKCVGCGRCIGTCNFDAIENLEYSANDILNKKIAEYSKAVLSGKEHFHISFVVNVSPNCDCHAENDAAIIPDVGMFASFDPVALDMACVDAANKQVVIRDSYLGEKEQHTSDHFINNHPETNWEVCIDHAVKLGLGNKEYKLIEI